jgi:hypothetical protein
VEIVCLAAKIGKLFYRIWALFTALSKQKSIGYSFLIFILHRLHSAASPSFVLSAGYFIAGENDLEPVPAGMDMDLACLGEPIGCAVYAGLQSRVQLGDTIAIFGMGFAGQIMA